MPSRDVVICIVLIVVFLVVEVCVLIVSDGIQLVTILFIKEKETGESHCIW